LKAPLQSGAFYFQALMISEFYKRFSNFSDRELIRMLQSPAEFTPEALEAVRTLIKERGGEQKILAEEEIRLAQERQEGQIRTKAYLLALAGNSEFSIDLEIFSAWPRTERNEKIVSQAVAEALVKLRDEKIGNNTIRGCVLGGIAGYLVSTTLYFFIFFFSNRFPLLITIAPAVLNYFIIHWISGQSLKNKAVLIAAIAASVLAFISGIAIAVMMRNF
jgi:hypothetical protein